MIELPAILDRIRHEPDHEPNWFALADWFRDNGQNDLAAVVRRVLAGHARTRSACRGRWN